MSSSDTRHRNQFETVTRQILQGLHATQIVAQSGKIERGKCMPLSLLLQPPEAQP
jgi:hypothetical protein